MDRKNAINESTGRMVQLSGEYTIVEGELPDEFRSLLESAAGPDAHAVTQAPRSVGVPKNGDLRRLSEQIRKRRAGKPDT